MGLGGLGGGLNIFSLFFCSILIYLILLAKASVLKVSSNWEGMGFKVTIMRMWQVGSMRLSFNTLVSLLSR